MPERDLLYRKFDLIGIHAELALVLLYSTIFGIFGGSAVSSYRLEAESHRKDLVCWLPRNQWVVEARHLFETTLANMQWHCTPKFRGMCKMGKIQEHRIAKR